jgi:hypothetical protein
MACSAYGMPKPYSNYPEYSSGFYEKPKQWYQEPSNDPYNNFTSQSVQQKLQLNRNALMPASWNSVSAAQAGSSGNKDDWSRYSVTEEGVERYISASGAVRFTQIDRSSRGRRIGVPNLLRSQPPAALSMDGVGSSENGPWFNDSSDRQVLVRPRMKPWVGCGN